MNNYNINSNKLFIPTIFTESLQKKSADLEWIEETGIPVVSEDFFKSLGEVNYELADQIQKYLLADCVWTKNIEAFLTSINKTYESRHDKQRGEY